MVTSVPDGLSGSCGLSGLFDLSRLFDLFSLLVSLGQATKQTRETIDQTVRLAL